MDMIKVLLADDESRMRKLVKDFLSKKDIIVIEAEDGEQACDKFFANKDIALLILDVMMPKMDGWQVVREIRQYSKVPIIMLTAKADERDELLGFDLGVEDRTHGGESDAAVVGGDAGATDHDDRGHEGWGKIYKTAGPR